MRVRYIPQARADIKNIHDYIARNSHSAAQRIEKAIRAAATSLGRHPELGVATGYRNVRRRPTPKFDYAIFYHIEWDSNDISVLRVVHGKQVRDLNRIPEHS